MPHELRSKRPRHDECVATLKAWHAKVGKVERANQRRLETEEVSQCRNFCNIYWKNVRHVQGRCDAENVFPESLVPGFYDDCRRFAEFYDD